MRFLVDGMLGGLARWLRILGQDVKFDTGTEDKELLRIAYEENMILLTRDGELYQRAKARRISSALVLGETEEERLAQIASIFDIHLYVDMTQTRCTECGAGLKETPKSDVADEVPKASLKLYGRFWKCTDQNCGKVYWVGSHWDRIRQTLEEARKLASMKQ